MIPTSLLEEFDRTFPTEHACLEQLFQTKWPEGYACPRCGHGHAYLMTSRRLPLYECRQCSYQASLLTDTVMEGSRTDLRKWFLAIWLLSRSECGTTAAALSEIIRVTYKTAWLMLHKIRHAINESEDDRLLSGIVRVNPACYGRPHNPSVFRHPQEHPFLVGSSVDEQGSPLQIKLVLLNVRQHMNESKGILRSGIQFFTNRHIDPHAHDLEFVKNQYARNRIRALLEVARAACRWINTTFHSLGRKHLQAYLNEFGYRYNQSLLDEPPFCALLTLCASSKKIRYADLTTAAA